MIGEAGDRHAGGHIAPKKIPGIRLFDFLFGLVFPTTYVAYLSYLAWGVNPLAAVTIGPIAFGVGIICCLNRPLGRARLYFLGGLCFLVMIGLTVWWPLNVVWGLGLPGGVAFCATWLKRRKEIESLQTKGPTGASAPSDVLLNHIDGSGQGRRVGNG